MASRPKKEAGVCGRVVRALLLDVVLIAIGLCVFALFHHVLPSAGILVQDDRVESEVDPLFGEALGDLKLDQTGAAPSAGPTETPEPTVVPTVMPEETATPEETPVPTGMPLETAVPATAPSIAPESTQEVHFPGEEVGEWIGEVRATQPPAAVQSAAPGDFSALFDSVVPDTQEAYATKDEYISDDIYIRITEQDAGYVVFYVADIYVRDIKNLRTAFANDTYGRGQRAYAWDIAVDHRAILAVNGDYYSAREDGVVIRNGVLYRETLYQDVCVLYQDGTMETYTAEQFDLNAVQQRGAWQAWSFGPGLLDENGAAQTKFNSAVVNNNPRCGIGYFEPGHYCFVVVDGRSELSRGVTLAEFSLIFEQLGCKAAYNMDGGNTAVMTYGKTLVSEPSQGGRAVSDIIMIAEVDDE